jgi:hypothetical protein
MAIGEYWAYREVDRNEVDHVHMAEQIRHARGKDTLYVPSPELTHSSSSFIRAPSPPGSVAATFEPDFLIAGYLRKYISA